MVRWLAFVHVINSFWWNLVGKVFSQFSGVLHATLKPTKSVEVCWSEKATEKKKTTSFRLFRMKSKLGCFQDRIFLSRAGAIVLMTKSSREIFPFNPRFSSFFFHDLKYRPAKLHVLRFYYPKHPFFNGRFRWMMGSRHLRFSCCSKSLDMLIGWLATTSKQITPNPTVGSRHHQRQKIKSKKLKLGVKSLPSSKKIMTDLNDTNITRVSMEVIVAIVSKLVYFKYLRDASNLLI